MPVDAHCSGTPIGKPLCRIMTTGAGYGAIRREHRVEKQVAPKIYLLRSKPLAELWQPGFEAADPRIAERSVFFIAIAQYAAAVL